MIDIRRIFTQVEDIRHEFGVSGRTTTDHEKGCSHLVLGEDLQNPRRVCRVRPVVEGERHALFG